MQKNWRPTSTLCASDEGWTGFACSALPGSGKQHSDLILRVRVKVPQLVVGRIDGVGLRPAARCHPVLNLEVSCVIVAALSNRRTL